MTPGIEVPALALVAGKVVPDEAEAEASAEGLLVAAGLEVAPSDETGSTLGVGVPAAEEEDGKYSEMSDGMMPADDEDVDAGDGGVSLLEGPASGVVVGADEGVGEDDGGVASEGDGEGVAGSDADTGADADADTDALGVGSAAELGMGEAVGVGVAWTSDEVAIAGGTDSAVEVESDAAGAGDVVGVGAEVGSVPNVSSMS